MSNEDAESIARQSEATVLSFSPPGTAALFPVFPHFTTTPNATSNVQEGNFPASEWLRNTSFTTNLDVINDAVDSNYESHHFTLESDSEEDQEKVGVNKSRLQHELLESSPSDSGSESKRNKKKRKKRRRVQPSTAAASLYEFAPSSRKPGVRAWAPSSSYSSSSSSTANSKEYFFDSRGDRDNLAFGSLYKMDVARHKLHYSGKTHGPSYYRSKRMSSILDGDNDVDLLDGKLLSGGRYWSPQYAALERHKNLKHVRVLARQRTESSDIADFIPLNENSVEQNPLSATVVEESWEDEVLRQTKEFNRLTRERPHDEKVWMSFAEFQDKVAIMQQQKVARLQTLEKKISILEKATELNPENEELILSLLRAYQSRDGSDTLVDKWEKILVQNSGSQRLWKEFLRVIQGEFSRFKVSEMRKMFINAIQALSGACNKQHRQINQSATSQPSKDPVLVHLEHGLVDIFISLCRFEWQTGYQELATALLQAEIEYSLFSPSLFLSEQSKRKLFEHFWNGNGARVGEEGALGWSTWLGKEEEERQKLVAEDLSNNDEGGWTGWSEPLSKATRVNEAGEESVIGDLIADESDDVGSANDDDYEDTEILLKKLGIDVAVDADIAIKDSKTWKKWSAEELTRDCSQWMPLRTINAGISDGDAMEADEQLIRVVLYEDVADYLFSISSVEARLSLVSQFIEFYGGRISQWTCTNSSSWTESVLSLEYFSYSLLDNLRIMHDVIKDKENTPMVWLEDRLNGSDDVSMRTNMMRFIRNATLLCLQAFPQNHVLEEAILIAEEMTNTHMNSSKCPVTPCRALAKSLLKSNRQDVLLCGVYAKREAAFGNIDQARKIFDMALSSIDGLSQDFRSKASLLYLWYAEVELADVSVGSSELPSRAIHILSCLGSGVKYSPNSGQLSSLQQLRARQGFREHIRNVRAFWTHGMIDDSSIALVSSAALFEDLTAGPAAALDILEEAFTMVLPERRRNSYQLEVLFNFYLRILSNHHKELKFSKIWETILKGLQIYPQSPCLYKFLVEISYFYTSPSKLRWILDDFCRRKQSVTAFLFSISFEMAKGSSNSKQRIRSVFEKSLGYFGNSLAIWRLYVAYESGITCDHNAARRVFFRAIHACPWSKKLWLDGFIKLSSVLTAKELSDLQEVMRDKELNLRTDVYEILLQDDMEI